MSSEKRASVGGPFVTQAAFCERVLNEKDGVLSAIRIVDTVITRIVPLSQEAVAGPKKPDRVKRKLFALITLKSGDIKGKRTVRLSCSSLEMETSVPVVFEGGHSGVNLILEMDLEMPEGTHWFSVHVGGTLTTKMPLRAIIQLGELRSTTSESQTATHV